MTVANTSPPMPEEASTWQLHIFGSKLVGVVSTALLAALGIAIWAIGSNAGWWNRSVLPEPLAVLQALGSLMSTSDLWTSIGRTVAAILASFVIGSAIGFLTGVMFWRKPTLGRILEPYVITVYAVPIVVFYPVMIVAFGLTIWSLIILASIVVSIPVVINTWIGLEAVPSIYSRLAASLQCSRRQALFRLALPAAIPQFFAGLRISAIFSIVAIVSMEFLLAPDGLGFHVRYEYHAFRNETMFAYIVIIFILAVLFASLVRLAEARVLAERVAAK